MAGETSGPGPSEQEIRMVALERKFDELLSFVQLIAKRNTDDENQRKEDDKDTSEAEPEGHSNTNATPPRPPTPPKPEGKDSQLDSKIDSLEEKIRLIQGLNSFGNTDFLEHVLVPQHDDISRYPDRECSRMVLTVEEDLSLEGSWQIPSLAQYGFQLPNSSGSDSILQEDGRRRAMKPSGNMPKGGERKAARARPPLDEREMIKIFVDTLKNPYFDRMMGLQMQFFVDLIPVGDRIRRCLERQRKIVDMTALMALAEQAAKKAPTKRKEGDVQMIGRNNGRPRQVLPTFTMQPIQPRPIQAPAPTQVPAPAPAPQMPARPVKETNPMTTEKSLISPIVPRPYNGPARKGFQPKFGLRFPLWRSGTCTVENCGQLRHRVQDLIDHGSPEVSKDYLTSPPTLCLNHPEGGVNMVEIEEGNEESIAWRRLFYTLEKKKTHHPVRSTTGAINRGRITGWWGEKKYHRKGSRQPDDPSDFDWYAEINLDDIVEDEMDLDNLQDEEADWGYFMEDDTDEWRDVDFTEFFQFPCLIVPPGFVTPEFEIFYEDGDPEVHLQKYGEKMALHLENELLMISVFPESLKMKSPTSSPTREWVKVIVEIKEESSVLSLPALTEGEEEEEVKPLPPAKDPDNAPLPKKERSHQGTTAKQSSPPPLLKKNMLALWLKEPREVKIGTRCAAEQKEALIALLREFHEIFAWSYQDMPGLDTDIVVHKIPLKPECKPVKASTATDEARSHFEDQGRGGKAIEGRFPKHSNLFGLGSQYSPGAEKGRKTTNVVFSFMDGFSGYNQIKMAEEDKSKTAFITHWGTFVYDVMPFGLKNAGATYQRAMVTLFHDMIHHEIEVYVDDMIAKSRTAQDHLTDLRKLFQRLKKYQLRLNPNKCAFGVTSGKLLGFIVSGRGIEIDPAKLTATCEPLFKLLRKDVKIKWTEDCQRAFDKIKEYLLNPPILVPPTPGRPLILYLTVQEASMGCMLGQQDETGKKEQAIYYLSKKFTEPETRYLLVEKTCCALAWASKKLRQYMLYYTTWLAIKGQAIADYLADYPSEQLELMDSEFPDEDVMTVDEDNHGRWKLYFDGAANAVGSGIGAVLVSPKGQQTPIAVKLGFDCTNNMTEYEACIVGLQAALEFGAYELEVFGDSLLIVSQTNGEWQARDPKLIPYQRYISRLVPKFKYVTFTYTPRAHNHFADALATLASLIKLVEGDDVRPLRIETRDIPAYCVCIEECMNVEAEIDNKPWRLTGHEFILVAIDYFTKWVEACSFKNVTQVAVTRFVKNNIICRYGMPEDAHHRQCFQPKQPHDGSAMPAVQDPAPQLCSIPSEDERSRRSCQQELRTSVGATPYSLVYGMEAVLPVEVEIPSLRILSQTQLEEAEWAQARYEQLNFIDEKRLAALCHGQLYQRRIERAYNKKARPRTFQPGDLVLKKRNMALSDPRGKFAPSYEGPYVVKKAFSGGAIILADMDGEEFRSPINSDSVIKYHV
uniref:RNase H type-1 domain-containing protein n=1 Tax=Fagus sylvatica TaxID=28930 RepID=A0A2N9FER3_FAGSY